MRQFLMPTVLAAVLSVSATFAQEDKKPTPCSEPEFRQLDFWVGTWDLSWTEKGGTSSKGKNVISRSLDNCVIEEHFTSFEGKRPFAGMSVSTYDTKTKSWRQTWVDNVGNYLPFTGGPSEEGFQLRAVNTDKDRRMIWKNVEKDSLDWHWQQSEDGGKSWKDVWVIHYERAE